MKKEILKRVYFRDADDRNLDEFTVKSLPSGLFWLYIALNSKQQWDAVFKKLGRKNKPLFVREYNRAFLSSTFSLFTFGLST